MFQTKVRGDEFSAVCVTIMKESGMQFYNLLVARGGGNFSLKGTKYSFDLVARIWEENDTVLFQHVFLKLAKILINDKRVSLWEYFNRRFQKILFIIINFCAYSVYLMLMFLSQIWQFSFAFVHFLKKKYFGTTCDDRKILKYRIPWGVNPPAPSLFKMAALDGMR